MPRRGLALLLLALVLAGCSTPPVPPSPEPVPHLLALDGRWDFPRDRAEALLADAGVGPVLGGAWFGVGILHAAQGPLAADHAALDEAALAALAPGVPAPIPGGVVVSADYAARHGLAPGERVELRAWRWPAPLVATSFEMERVRPCDPEAPARLCASSSLDPTQTQLRLRVDEGSRDLAFLPDMAELGAGGAPAWWNGTFASPQGAETPFQAHVDARGAPSSGEREGPLEPGTWTIRYHLETLRLGRAPAGLAGIVRLREPGYHWFDDRLQRIEDPERQAESVLAAATAANVTLTVQEVAPLPPILAGFDLLLHPLDARALEGVGPARVGAVLVNATPGDAARVALARENATDHVTLALQFRPFAPAPPLAAQDRVLLFRAPPDVDVAALPAVEGAGTPTKALALLPGVATPVALDGRNLTQGVLLLAHAGPEPRPPPWTMPPGGRWATAGQALENLTRSRTLVLASDDLAPRDVAVARLVMGDEVTGRVSVVVGVVDGGPRGVLWASPPLAAGAGEPAGARVLLPVEPGADPAEVLARAAQAWAPLGLAPEASRKP